jgi:hypothetical protein
MMQTRNQDLSRLLAFVVEHLDIPKSLYEKAAKRHVFLGEWLHRDGSGVARFDPDVRPQGSFRFGTVNRPIHDGDEYDLDNVCVLRALRKTDITQEELKQLYGTEIRAYAKANNMLSPPKEHNRCWRLPYADEVPFHLDTLPCVPEERGVVEKIISFGVSPELAGRAVAITDKRHPQYRVKTSGLLSSNPRGFAAWFEQRAALGRSRSLVENKLRAEIERVPPYEWKTMLQRSIQILKRHRDVMFEHEPDLAPISMIITNLAARAYEGETDLAVALVNILEKMPNFVRTSRPYVPNPADPAEDYADKWARDSRLQKNFWEWHAAAKAAIAGLASFLGKGSLETHVQKLFLVDLTQDELRQFKSATPAIATVTTASAPAIISSAPRPWGRNV